MENIWKKAGINEKDFKKVFEAISNFADGKSTDDIMNYIIDRYGKSESFDKIIAYFATCGIVQIWEINGIKQSVTEYHKLERDD